MDKWNDINRLLFLGILDTDSEGGRETGKELVHCNGMIWKVYLSANCDGQKLATDKDTDETHYCQYGPH